MSPISPGKEAWKTYCLSCGSRIHYPSRTIASDSSREARKAMRIAVMGQAGLAVTLVLCWRALAMR